jgi:hypothetical protein
LWVTRKPLLIPLDSLYVEEPESEEPQRVVH